jgi:hypothetical protein
MQERHRLGTSTNPVLLLSLGWDSVRDGAVWPIAAKPSTTERAPRQNSTRANWNASRSAVSTTLPVGFFHEQPRSLLGSSQAVECDHHVVLGDDCTAQAPELGEDRNRSRPEPSTAGFDVNSPRASASCPFTTRSARSRVRVLFARLTWSADCPVRRATERTIDSATSTDRQIWRAGQRLFNRAAARCLWDCGCVVSVA